LLSSFQNIWTAPHFQNMLPIFWSWFCPAFWWRESNIYSCLVFSVFTSRPTSLLETLLILWVKINLWSSTQSRLRILPAKVLSAEVSGMTAGEYSSWTLFCCANMISVNDGWKQGNKLRMKVSEPWGMYALRVERSALLTQNATGVYFSLSLK
jgi:hypothetical protein